MMMRRRGPGLVGTMARTAVIAGTATAVSGAVAGHQQQKAMEKQAGAEAQYQAQQDSAQVQQMQAQLDAMQAQQAAAAVAPAAAAPAAAGGTDIVGQLQQLEQLKAAGVLDDTQYAAAKNKILGI
jgi:microsomal dipeptidase-like Zn-dependent dipeptidase